MSSPWIILIFAGILEVCWAVGLKYTEGFSRLGPSIFTLITLAGSMYLLSKSAQSLPIGTANTAWVGIGAVGASIFGILFLKEPATLIRLFFMAMLIVSVIGLKISAN